MTENTELDPKVSSSPERDTFQKQKYIERKAKLGEEPSADYLEMFETLTVNKKNRMRDPAWRVDNMEYDLRTTDWILDKVRNSDTYAQNLYAALCNNGFIKNDVWPILTEKEWGCSWRYAGGLVADLQDKGGDYMDWYCSGIGAKDGDYINHVGEGNVTDEIAADLALLGWRVSEEPNSE